jgi:phosphate transport system substrate-binding protein
MGTRQLWAVACALSVAVAATVAGAADITGAGATFPFPIYAKWAEAYKAKTGVGMNYQSIGSGGGIKQIQAKTVDFGASDAPLKPEELDKSGLMQFPAIIGGIVPVVNLDGVAPGAMKLTGPVLADIYLGKLKKWNEKPIADLNPTLKLADENITVVRRSDGSGTTFNFTDYLSKVSPEWKEKVGSATAVSWPEGVGGKGNEGVSSYVQRIKGAIGYVEYAYAKKNNMSYALVQNKDGQYPKPNNDTFQAAAAYADWKNSPGYYQIITNSPGADSWPIAATSFILLQKTQDKPASGQEVLKFFDWSFKNGQKMADELDYVALPPALISQIEASWKTQLKDASGNPIWK